MKKYIVAILAISLLSGCSTIKGWFGIDDLPYDLIMTVALADGTQLVVDTTADGSPIYGQYVSKDTGIVYRADPDGTISASWTDPEGNVQEIKLVPKAEE